MAKIAAALETALSHRDLNGLAGSANAHTLASGERWTITDLICTCGPDDRSFEEHHTGTSIAIVTAGSFQYRSASHDELMTPGCILLGNPGQAFECTHRHGVGDRCLAFHYTPDYFQPVAADATGQPGTHRFDTLRLPPMRALSPLVTQACIGVVSSSPSPWEELSLTLATTVPQLATSNTASTPSRPPLNTAARITRAIRRIERHPGATLTLASLARHVGLSLFHFLRTFQQVTGLTPHQYILRTRLRDAATRLALEQQKILDIALGCGFGDVSNFNRAFRAEFAKTPRAYRAEFRSRNLRSKAFPASHTSTVHRSSAAIETEILTPLTNAT